MNDILVLLLQLQRLSVHSAAEQSHLTIIAFEDVVEEACAWLEAKADRDEVQVLLSQAAHQNKSISEYLAHMQSLAERFAAQLLPQQRVQLTTSLKVIEELLLLRRCADASFVHRTELRALDTRLFRYIATLHVVPLSGQVHEVLVGQLPGQFSQQGITVMPLWNHELGRRSEIRYVGSSPYPHLNLRVPSRYGQRGIQASLDDWVQRPMSIYDLEVYNFQERLLGNIVTRHKSLPEPMLGSAWSVLLPQQSQIEYIETQFLDAKHQLLARYVRII